MLRHLPEDQSHLDRFPECANGLAPLTYLYRLACPLSFALFRGRGVLYSDLKGGRELEARVSIRTR
jgi:hypothetical protein